MSRLILSRAVCLPRSRLSRLSAFGSTSCIPRRRRTQVSLRLFSRDPGAAPSASARGAAVGEPARGGAGRYVWLRMDGW